jgi:plasmid stability protein
MASITIGDIDDDLKQRLEQRAAVHGRSMEAEARGILEDALGTKPSAPVPGNLADAIRAIVEPLGGIELEPFPRRPVRGPPTFE